MQPNHKEINDLIHEKCVIAVTWDFNKADTYKF